MSNVKRKDSKNRNLRNGDVNSKIKITKKVGIIITSSGNEKLT